jgi:hypothetical protein
MIGERTRHAPSTSGSPFRLMPRALAAASTEPRHCAPHRALHQGWPHIEQCHCAGFQRARHRGNRMAADGFRCRFVASAIVSAYDDRARMPRRIRLAPEIAWSVFRCVNTITAYIIWTAARVMRGHAPP